MQKLSKKSIAIITGLTILAVVFTGCSYISNKINQEIQPDLTYSLKDVDCSQEAKDIRDKTPRGEYSSTAISDACVITLTVKNNENESAGVDYLAIGGGPAGTFLNKPPIRIYSGNGYCFGLPTEYGFKALSETDVWVECLGSNDERGQDMNADQRPTKIVINGRTKTVLSVENLESNKVNEL